MWRVVEIAAWALFLSCLALLLAIRAVRFVVAFLIPALFLVAIAAGVVCYALEQVGVL
jgi:hypothetical protein